MAAGFLATGSRLVRVEIASGFMDVAAQLAALFWRQTPAAGLCSIALTRGPLLGRHHPLRTAATGIAPASRTIRSLCRRACGQKPQDTRHARQNRPAMYCHNLSFSIINAGHCCPVKFKVESL